MEGDNLGPQTAEVAWARASSQQLPATGQLQQGCALNSGLPTRNAAALAAQYPREAES